MKIFKKSLSVILAILIILTTFLVAIPVFAEGNIFVKKDVAKELYVQEEMTSKIVSEVTELREEYAKHFVCEDGSYVVATYNDPIHYKEDGQWKEIDNSLKLSSDAKSGLDKAMYAPKAGTVDVKIPQNLSAGEKVSATNKGYTISFGANHDKVIYANKPTAVVKNVEDLSSSKLTDKTVAAQNSVTATASVEVKNEITTFNNDAMAVDNQAGAVVYENVFGNDDLEYIVTTNSIKENIVVNEKQEEYIYSFDMDFGELTPVVNEDNSIRVVEPETEETVFYIAAPYMYDANEIESTAIEMSLVEEDDIYVMTLQADAEWVNSSERAFPVVIDPTVYLSFDDVFVMDGLLNKNTTKITNELRVGRNLTNLTRTYIKPTVPTNIPAGSYISSAYLRLTKDYYFQALGASDISIRAYDCYDVKSWNPTSVTWENQPYNTSDNGYSSGHSYLSSVSATSSKSTYSFSITAAVRRWLDGGVNNGIMLASSNESSKTQIDFHSSRASDSNNYPNMYISYTAPTISPSTMEMNSRESMRAFAIRMAGDWTAYTDADWISLEATSGTTSNGTSINKVMVTENTSAEPRTGTVTVKFGNTIIGTLTVNQIGINPSLLMVDNNFFFESTGGTISTEIVSNVNWQPSTESDWISFDKEQINDETYKLDISISSNDTYMTREGKISIDANGLESQEIEITQLDTISGYFNEINSEKTALTVKNSSEYNHALATWAMYLSNAAYNPLPDDMLLNIPESFMTDFTTIESVMTINCFDDIEQYHYDSAELNTAAHTIAHKKIVDTDGSYKTLIAVTVRGTAAALEWITDVASLLQSQNMGFIGAKNEVISNLNDYLQEYENNFEDERIILVTGHSMGAAVANLVADALNCSADWDDSNVYAYTFATPKVGQNITTEYNNIFNILNRSDYVTLVPFSLIPSAIAGDHKWGRHGIDIPVSMTRGEDIAENHKMDTYYDFMISQEPTLNYIGITAISNNDVRMGILPKLLSMKCPVGVTVYNSDGEIMAYESQQEVVLYTQNQTAESSDVVSWISEDGEKVFFIPYGSDASSVSIEAYDYGSMTFSIANVDTLNAQPSEIKTFENVNLYPEKEFSVGLSEYVPIEDTKLYVVKNGIIVDEVTELNPHLKGVSLDDTNITYGTLSTLTIKTDNTVSEITIINTDDSSSATFSSNADSNITITEDGDDFIWNIQIVFPVGSSIYDVAVKKEDTWYVTNNVFAITVS